MLKDVYLPPHVYGQLVQKKNGFKLLQRCVSGHQNGGPNHGTDLNLGEVVYISITFHIPAS